MRPPSHTADDACPACCQSTVHEKAPGMLARITWQPSLTAKIYPLQKLRCHLLRGQVFTAATQGDVPHNDDTTVKILELMGKRGRQEVLPDTVGDVEVAESRGGQYTSGVVALLDGHRVAQFFSKRRHAGENLAQVLEHRAARLSPPIQMCAALSRNLPGELETILTHCLAHARRRFVEVYDRFPEPCRHFSESLAVIYRNDAVARERRLSPEARLRFRQEVSGPTMQALRDWLTRRLAEKRAEPNSDFGGAITDMLKHWDRLTLVLR